MGIVRENGYSASIEGYLIVAGRRFRLAKTNGVELVLADASCQCAPGTEAELLIIVDGDNDTTRITLPTGITLGQGRVRYEEFVPF